MNVYFSALLIRIAIILLSIFCGGLATPSLLRAQTAEADSLKKLLFTYSKRLPPTDTIVINCLNQIAYVTRNNIHDTALAYSQEAFRRSAKIGYVRGQAEALLVEGIVAIYEGHYNAALEMHVQGIDFYRSLGDTVNEGALLNNIGYLYKAQGKNVIAKDYFRRSEALFLAANNTSGLSLVWGNLGDIALKEGDLNEALRLERNALAKGIIAKDRYYQGIARYHIGTIFFAMEQYDSALTYQRYALEMFIADGNQTYIIRVYENIAKIYAAKNRFPEAFAEAKRGLLVAENARYPIETILIYDCLSDLYTRSGKYERALNYFRRTAALRDSVMIQNVEQRMKVLDMIRQAEKSQKDLLVVEKDQARLQVWRNSLIGGIILTLLMLALALNRYRFKSRSEKALREVNEIIVRQQSQLQEQSVHIQNTNTELELTNTELDVKNDRLNKTNTCLELANERLAALNHEKDELLSIVAHDLKNPLTGILMTSTALKKQATTSPEPLPNERVITHTERIIHSSERMMSIITKLLHLSLLEQGESYLQPLTFDIARLVRQIAEEHYVHARAKSITIVLEIPTIAVLTFADPDASAEVIENLIDNAVKYSPHGKRVFVRVLGKDGGKKITDEGAVAHASLQIKILSRIEVQDEGAGISPEEMTKLFGKFVRLSTRPTGGEDSTGLGLSIVKKIVEEMNGRVWCESVLGKGARFIVELPEGTIPNT
jgi:signal transduction histidine kinase